MTRLFSNMHLKHTVQSACGATTLPHTIYILNTTTMASLPAPTAYNALIFTHRAAHKLFKQVGSIERSQFRTRLTADQTDPTTDARAPTPKPHDTFTRCNARIQHKANNQSTRRHHRYSYLVPDHHAAVRHSIPCSTITAGRRVLHIEHGRERNCTVQQWCPRCSSNNR